MRSSSVVRGGLVVLLGTLLPAAALAQGVTFANDVAPILYEHCVACHRPCAIGPFSLVSYEDARAQAEQVAAAAERRAMPPWKPVAGYGQFQGARTLSEAQIAVLGQWVESDTPQGDAAATPPVPRFEDGGRRGEPDLVLTVDTPYTLEAGSGGVYRNFVVPTELTDQRWVSAVELRPSAASVVHHARILLDATGDARIAVAADVASGYDGLMLDHGGFPDGHVLGWSAGPPPAIAPTALAWQLNPGTDLVVQLYLLRRAASVTVQPSIGLSLHRRPTGVFAGLGPPQFQDHRHPGWRIEPSRRGPLSSSGRSRLTRYPLHTPTAWGVASRPWPHCRTAARFRSSGSTIGIWTGRTNTATNGRSIFLRRRLSRCDLSSTIRRTIPRTHGPRRSRSGSAQSRPTRWPS